MKVLLVAFAISPEAGSESGAGWAALKAHVFLGHETILLTTSKAADELMDHHFLKQFNVKCVGISEPPALIKDSSRMPFKFQLRHLIWNLKIIRPVKELLHENPETIVHYATFAGDWNLNVLHILNKSVYKIWGPVGGAQNIPIKMIPFLGILGSAEEIFKRIIGRFFARLHVFEWLDLGLLFSVRIQHLKNSFRSLSILRYYKMLY